MSKENFFEKSDFFQMKESERYEALNENCEEVKNGYNYSKPLSKFEVETKNSEINQALAEIERLKSERKELNALIKIQNETVAMNNHSVVRGFDEVTERIWLVSDVTTGYTQKINAEGYIIEKHRFKEGTTMSLFNKKEKTGTDNESTD